MAWYDAGTVNVTLNSATVTGVNTQWVAGARQGEAFVGPDGRLYEVLNIASDTSLTLTRPYRGATQAAQSYALAPFHGYVKELADRAAELLRRYYDALTLAENSVQKSSVGSKYGATVEQILPGNAYGLGGAPDPYPHASVNTHATPGEYVCATGVADTPDGLPGVLIREGLSGPDSACLLDRFCTESGRQFWRARAGIGPWSAWSETLTASNAIPLLGLKSAAFADLIGDVSAGAVMQSGSNANGTWVRFADGTQICHGHFGFSGSSWKPASPVIHYPLSFISKPAVTIQSMNDGSGYYTAAQVAMDTSAGSFYIRSSTGVVDSGTSLDGDYIAIGRWKA
ncbi:hypothetical protein [Alcaligenes faecalis]|uniref:hypothetical protein n=1 Tax=Alcaligenes faecalis TaxID=511 RepID=UPI00208FB29D|nr:hypothetical protein [Alcaligenes faecalis]USP49373.1 hypothetical protein J5J84_07785 [Alcaligenes faecalis]